ncbi:MAG: sulfate adenylyltransferase subunit CysN [Pseudomonadota bacterium]
MAAPESRVLDLLAARENRSQLRIVTCGSVDDGKSTLIGRLLYDTRAILEDQLQTLEKDSRVHGTDGDNIDFALLVDGLEAEREQGITIDVAYRFLSTPSRHFIIADTPGHEQYTRNMATGASTADVAIVLIDARRGVLTQTRRHSHIASLLGIPNIVLAVNKIDLVDYSEDRFREIVNDYETFASDLGFSNITAIPLSARHGDNVTEGSARTPWYTGAALLPHLESIGIDDTVDGEPFRFPVQMVHRPNLDFRGYAGTVASGSVSVGHEVVAARSGKSSKVVRIAGRAGDQPRADKGDAVTLLLADEIELSRGNVLAARTALPNVSDQFEATLVWFDDDASLMPGRPFILRMASEEVPATVTALKYAVDVNTFVHEATRSLSLNEIGVANISTRSPLAFDSYRDNRSTGSFILIDRMTNATVAAGMINHPLRRASNVHWQALDITKTARAEAKHQKPAVLWFTGLSGSGKSTIANALEKMLHASGRHTIILDGDNVRHGLNRDLGFTDEDRVENIRRVAEVAKLMTEAGLIVLVSFISPFAAERLLAREMMEEGEFVEIFVDTPLEACIARDPKGLYGKALAGELKNFTGIDSPFEAPQSPDIHLKTEGSDVDELAQSVEQWLRDHGVIH